MRLLEVNVLIVNVVWIIHMMFFKRRKGEFLILIVSGTVLVLQLLLEGYRFHALPLYLQFIILSVLTLKAQLKNGLEPRKTILRKMGIAAIWTPYLIVAVLLPSFFPVFTYSMPSGPYSIGTKTYDMIDSTRDEILSEEQNDNRKIAIQVWYPAEPKKEAERSKLIANPKAVANGLERMTKVPYFFFDHLKYIETYGVEDAPVSLEKTNYPVILFSHGYGSGYRSQSLYQVQELASQGYIVVTIDHTYFSLATIFTNGKSVPFKSDLGWPTLINDKSREYVDMWAQDARFVLDQLEIMNKSNPQSLLHNKLDLSKVGYLGASFGGPVAARIMQLDDRFKAGVNQDAKPFYHEEIVQKGLEQPFMYMQSSQRLSDLTDDQLIEYGVTREQWNRLPQEMDADIQRFYSSLKGKGYIVKFEGTEHLTFSDMYLFIKIPNSKNVEIARAHRMINDYTVAFFNKHLLGQVGDNTHLMSDSRKYPEVIDFKEK